MSFVGIADKARINPEKILVTNYLKNNHEIEVYAGEQLNENNRIFFGANEEEKEKFFSSLKNKKGFILLGDTIILNTKKVSGVIFKKNYDYTIAYVYFEKCLKEENAFTINLYKNEIKEKFISDLTKRKNFIMVEKCGIINKEHVLCVVYNEKIQIYFGNNIDVNNKMLFSRMSKEDIQTLDEDLRNKHNLKIVVEKKKNKKN